MADVAEVERGDVLHRHRAITILIVDIGDGDRTIAVMDELVVAIGAMEADDREPVGIADHRHRAGAVVNDRVVGADHDRVVAGATIDHVAVGLAVLGPRAPVDQIVATARMDDRSAGTGFDKIVAGAARQRIICSTTDDDVVAGTTLDKHVPSGARRIEHAVPAAAENLLQVIRGEVDRYARGAGHLGDVEAGPAVDDSLGVHQEHRGAGAPDQGVGASAASKPVGIGVGRGHLDRVALRRAEDRGCTSRNGLPQGLVRHRAAGHQISVSGRILGDIGHRRCRAARCIGVDDLAAGRRGHHRAGAVGLQVDAGDRSGGACRRGIGRLRRHCAAIDGQPGIGRACQADRRDAKRGEALDLGRLADAILVGILPDHHLVKILLARIGIDQRRRLRELCGTGMRQARQRGKAVGELFALEVLRDRLCDVGDRSRRAAGLEHQDAVVGIDPAGVVQLAVGNELAGMVRVSRHVGIEEDAVADPVRQIDAFAAEIDHQRIDIDILHRVGCDFADIKTRRGDHSRLIIERLGEAIFRRREDLVTGSPSAGDNLTRRGVLITVVVDVRIDDLHVGTADHETIRNGTSRVGGERLLPQRQRAEIGNPDRRQPRVGCRTNGRVQPHDAIRIVAGTCRRRLKLINRICQRIC